MAAVDEAAIGQQVAQLKALVALSVPQDLMAQASPAPIAKHRPARLAHLAVKTGVVRDNNRRIHSDPCHCGIVDPLPGQVRVADAGEPSDLRRDWLCGLVQLVQGIEHTIDATAGHTFGFEDAELDHLALDEVRVDGLSIDHHTHERGLVQSVQVIGQKL